MHNQPPSCGSRCRGAFEALTHKPALSGGQLTRVSNLNWFCPGKTIAGRASANSYFSQERQSPPPPETSLPTSQSFHAAVQFAVKFAAAARARKLEADSAQLSTSPCAFADEQVRQVQPPPPSQNTAQSMQAMATYNQRVDWLSRIMQVCVDKDPCARAGIFARRGPAQMQTSTSAPWQKCSSRMERKSQDRFPAYAHPVAKRVHGGQESIAYQSGPDVIGPDTDNSTAERGNQGRAKDTKISGVRQKLGLIK